MKVKIYVFAFLRDKLGWKEKVIELPGDEAALYDIITKIPELSKYVLKGNNVSEDFLILINGLNVKFTGGAKTIVKDGDEIAIFPLGGGGA